MAANRQIDSDPDTGAELIDQVNVELGALFNAATFPLANTGGTANAPECSVTPALAAGLVAGMKFTWLPAAGNTGSMTIKVGAEAAVPLVQDDGSAMFTGQLSANRLEHLYFDGTSMRVAKLAGIKRVYSRQVFTANGTWNNDVPADCLVLVEGWGPGGTGGLSSGSYKGSGGGGGGYCFAIFRAGNLPPTVAVTIGQSGTKGGTGNASNAGSDTTFGSHLKAYAGGPGYSSNSNSSGGAGAGACGRGAAGNGAATASAPGSQDGGTGSYYDIDASLEVPAASGTDGGGGGGASSPFANSVNENGARSNKGGGGGGGLDGTFNGNGGSSQFAGAGGAYGVDGSAPAGGGGGNALGARGEVRVTALG